MTKSKKNKELTKSEVPARLLDDGTGKKLKEIAPEKKYVRRTTEEFKAGAEPVRKTASHRFIRTNISMNPEVKTAAEAFAKQQGLTLSEWVRAAMRKALRDGMDGSHELDEPVTPVPPSKK